LEQDRPRVNGGSRTTRDADGDANVAERAVALLRAFVTDGTAQSPRGWAVRMRELGGRDRSTVIRSRPPKTVRNRSGLLHGLDKATPADIRSPGHAVFPI